MTIEELEDHIRSLGHTVELLHDGSGQPYTTIRDVTIPNGSLQDRRCDIALGRWQTMPYVLPAAIHTRPILIPMGQRNTQASGLGPDWQYWSRRFDSAPTPRGIWAHVLTVLGEV